MARSTRYRRSGRLARLKRCLFVALCALPAWLSADVPYDVKVSGLSDDQAIKVLEDTSLLYSLRERPPSTMTGLRRRAEADAEELLAILHNFAYHEAAITFDIVPSKRRTMVTINVRPGPRYTIGQTRLIPSSDLYPDEAGPRLPSVLDQLGPRNHGLYPGERAISTAILEGDRNLLRSLSKQGYPLAIIEHRDLRVDLATHQVHIDYYVSTGPAARFGPVSIEGLSKVSEQFVRDDILWCEGEPFTPCKIEDTEEALLGRQLFSLVHITYANEVDEDGLLPIQIKLQEGLHRSIGGGLSYTTQLGPGLAFEWENRNVGGLGQRLTILGDVWSKRQKAMLSYLRPNFGCPEQDFLLLTEYENEETQSFEEAAFSLSGLFTYRFSDRQSVSYGATVKQLRSRRSDNDSDFTLFKLPVEYRFFAVNNLLDPTKGRKFIIRVVPIQMLNRDGNWFDNRFTIIWYRPITSDHRLVFAWRGILGSLVGAGRRDIPAPERLYGGNETSLRGYKYQTVSPLDAEGNPKGGRSMMIFSNELRMKTSEKISVVGFHEYGNVYNESYPDFNGGIVHSLGAGVRYHTPVGPLRLDVAFPLNKRKNLDPDFQAYFSIGQAF